MLIDKIIEARQAARDVKDGSTADFLAVVIGDCTRATKTPTDEAVIAQIKKMIENAKIFLGDTIKVGNTEIRNIATQDQKDGYALEIKILEQFLPAQMTEEDIVAEIQKAKAAGKTDMKSLMAHFKDGFTGLYDGKLVSTLVKGAL